MSSSPSSPEVLKVAMCLYPGTQLLDFSGPLDLMGFLTPTTAALVRPPPPYALAFTQLGVGKRTTTSVGLVLHADSTYDRELAKEDGEQFDVLFVPGGTGSSPGATPESLIKFLQKQAPRAKYILAVCSGSWILQQAGLLDGKRATTNKSLYNFITAASAKEVQWVHKARYVVDGNVWTASGVAAGLDMALAWITHLAGPAAAAAVSGGAEYTGRSADNDEFADIWTDEAQAGLVDALGEWIKSL